MVEYTENGEEPSNRAKKIEALNLVLDAHPFLRVSIASKEAPPVPEALPRSKRQHQLADNRTDRVKRCKTAGEAALAKERSNEELLKELDAILEKEDYKESEEFKALTPEQVWDFIVVASTFVANALRLPDDDNTSAKVKLYRAFTVEGSSEPIYEDESAPSEV